MLLKCDHCYVPLRKLLVWWTHIPIVNSKTDYQANAWYLKGAFGPSKMDVCTQSTATCKRSQKQIWLFSNVTTTIQLQTSFTQTYKQRHPVDYRLLAWYIHAQKECDV